MSLHIEIQGFGEIQRAISQPFFLEIEQPSIRVKDIFEQLTVQFPHAVQALERCACAVDDQMLSRHSELTQSCTLVLLSPVAGG